MALHDPGKPFDDILQLLDMLESEHVDDQYVYRGQKGRYTHDWTMQSGKVRLESIYPSDFRFIARYSNLQDLTYSDVTAARTYGRKVRDIFVTLLAVKSIEGSPCWKWLEKDGQAYAETLAHLRAQQRDGRTLAETVNEAGVDISRYSTAFMRKAWSLAQHYLIATALTDVTYSPRIAAWFATQPWDRNDVAPIQGTGVIYRLHRKKLEQALAKHSSIMAEQAKERGDIRPPELFLVDIRDIPVEFARRPVGQQGGSVYGFDQLEVVFDLMQTGGLEVFEFRHGSLSAELDGLRSQTVPEDDPFSPIAELVNDTVSAIYGAGIEFSSRVDTEKHAFTREIFEALKLNAGLAIRNARLDAVIPLDDEYKCYHFQDIEESGQHGYAELLVVVNEKTSGILGYVSHEPVKPLTEHATATLHVTANWFNGRRVMADTHPNRLTTAEFLDLAIATAREAIGIGPKSRTAADLGELIDASGGLEEAALAMLQLFESGNLAAGVNLGMLANSLGHRDAAIHILQITADNGSPDAATNLGFIHSRHGHTELAQKAFLRALELGDGEARYNLGKLFESQKSWPNAETWYRASHEVDGDDRAPNNLAMVLLHQGKKDEARQYFEIGASNGDELAAYNLRTMFPD